MNLPPLPAKDYYDEDDLKDGPSKTTKHDPDDDIFGDVGEYVPVS